MTACAPFTPSDSEQRLLPPSYRGCWHGVGRSFLARYRHDTDLLGPCFSSPATELYDPRAFITHAALLRQAFAHCAIFPTAASRRSLGRVSVPVWLIILSNQLPIIALVGRYPANKLIGRKLLLKHEARRSPAFPFTTCETKGLSGISGPFEPLSQALGYITYVLLTRSPLSLHLHPKDQVQLRTTCMS